MITIDRFNYGILGPDHPCSGTVGILQCGGLILYTLEPPWENNRPNVSCIPEGTYELVLRKSSKVSQITSGRHTMGLEIAHVPGRSNILFHPLNWTYETEGCVGVGTGYGILDNRLAIKNSQEAFDLFMDAVEGEGVVCIGHYQCRY